MYVYRISLILNFTDLISRSLKKVLFMFRLLSASYLFVFLIAFNPFMTNASYAEPSSEKAAHGSSDESSTQKPNGEVDHSEAGKININTASASELQSLKGIGKKRAEQIVKDREVNGPFMSPQDLTRIKGIGPKTLAKNLAMITVGASTKPDEKSSPTQK